MALPLSAGRMTCLGHYAVPWLPCGGGWVDCSLVLRRIGGRCLLLLSTSLLWWCLVVSLGLRLRLWCCVWGSTSGGLHSSGLGRALCFHPPSRVSCWGYSSLIRIHLFIAIFLHPSYLTSTAPLCLPPPPFSPTFHFICTVSTFLVFSIFHIQLSALIMQLRNVLLYKLLFLCYSSVFDWRRSTDWNISKLTVSKHILRESSIIISHVCDPWPRYLHAC